MLGLSRGRLLAIAAVAAVALAAVLIGVSVLVSREGGGSQVTAGVELPGTVEVAADLRGVPQDGVHLGRADAASTLVEYADLQCPFCAEWAVQTLPTVIDDFVRPGKLRIEFRPLAFIGPDSEKAARAALAAGLQDRLWNAVDLLYVNQGIENTGWVSDELLAALGTSIAGLDGEQMVADMDSADVNDGLAAAESDATRDGVDSTPTFFAGPSGGTLTMLELTSLEPGPFTEALTAALGS